jgi:DnaK suppressor protein
MTMLNEDTMRLLEQRLQTQHTELKAALGVGSVDREIVGLSQIRVNAVSREGSMAEPKMSEATRTHMHTELRRIDAAIGRLNSGRYGVCCGCQNRVEVSRLHSDPATPFCLSCLEEMVEDRRRGLLRG